MLLQCTAGILKFLSGPKKSRFIRITLKIENNPTMSICCMTMCSYIIYMKTKREQDASFISFEIHS